MPLLTDDQRKALWADYMARNTEPVAILKADLRAAVNAVDAWLEANASAFNQAIPQPARGSLTAAQKARLLALVALKRHGD